MTQFKFRICVLLLAFSLALTVGSVIILRGTNGQEDPQNSESQSDVNQQSSEPIPSTQLPIQTTEPSTEETTEEQPSENAEATAVNKQMQIKEAVRIRAERSADSERLANAYAKELVKVIENYSDGWSKVEYNGVTGYCKTEYLEDAQ